MAGGLTSVTVVSLLVCLLHIVWASSPDGISVPVDVMILLEITNNMKKPRFEKVQDFIKSFVNDFDVGPNGLNLGVISFATDPHTEFWLNSYTTSSSLLAAIDRIEYEARDGPFVAEALKAVYQQAFTKANGDRADAPNILILFAVGVDSESEAAVLPEATELKKTNISIFVVTFYQQVTHDMKAIASKDENIFHVPDFNNLEDVHFSFTKAVHEAIKAMLPPKPTATPAPSYIPAPYYFPPQPPCVDSVNYCAEYGFLYCNPNSLWAQYICPRHCGTCVQHCDYGGQWYRQGAQWQDGCAYDCVCVDGATGHYQCYYKCPMYYFLPPHCTLVQLPDVCCLQPMCDFGAIFQVTTGQNVDNLNGHQACVYNGMKYHQSERWTVGCDLQCFCDDAAVGLYTCHSVCAWYGMLPSNCRLVSDSGECCAKPECQFYTTFGPFVGTGQPSGDGQSVYTVFIF